MAIERITDNKFELVSKYEPAGDQGEAIAELVDNIENGEKAQILRGATGTGKTYTMSQVIARTGKPTLVMAHNKTLAGQLYSEFKEFFHRYRQWYDSIILIANSIGAYFSMCALNNEQVDKAFFISPIVDMEKLILDMMGWADITEEKLREKQLITTGFGETLSWEYLCYVRNHPVNWSVPTYILYGDKDNLTSQETIHKFANDVNAELTIMQNGEHWFHTAEQMAFLDDWIRGLLK